jgi:hypothetical protein
MPLGLVLLLVQSSHIIQQLADNMPSLRRLRSCCGFRLSPIANSAVKSMPGSVKLSAERG